MDKIYKRYTIIAWFFTIYIGWSVLVEIILAALGDSSFSRAYPLHEHLKPSQLYWLNVLGLFRFVVEYAWLVMLALLAWTIRADYLARPNSSLTSVAGDNEVQNG